MKKDIYYAGRVYVGVDREMPTVKEDILDWENYLHKFPAYICFEPPFEDGQDVTGRYTKMPVHSPDIAGGNPTYAAVPLPKYTKIVPVGTEITSSLIYQTLKENQN